ncbi:MAG: FAD-dependent thymidylate synthase [Acidobacteria bacterium]|nr:FAD-dependent thymidylate synthase [Acidobacteriota bacterium]
MRVVAAGLNIDGDALRELREAAARLRGHLGRDEAPPPDLLAHLAAFADREDLTPETLSAAYARISRDPRPVDALRRDARASVAKARRSNETIVFGLGHASVAEHAVFNVDVLGLSRLAAEFVEHYRLASFTEKSQRYVTLRGDFVVPAEVTGTALEVDFREIVRRQTELYLRLYEALKPRFEAEHPDMAARADGRRTLDGWAKEDARYALSLAVETQLGMTVNARTVERMVRDAAGHPLAEVRAFGEALLGALHPHAPSLIRYTRPGPCQAEGLPALRAAAAEQFRRFLSSPAAATPESHSPSQPAQAEPGRADATRFSPAGSLACSVPPSREDPFECRIVGLQGSEADVFAALAFASAAAPCPPPPVVLPPSPREPHDSPPSHSSHDSHNSHNSHDSPLFTRFSEALAWAETLDDPAKTGLLRPLVRTMEPWDAPPRAFEHAGAAVECTVSASCFAQLKRHRMGSLLCRPYEPALGFTVPPSVEGAGLRDDLLAVARLAEETAGRIAERHPEAAAYLLANGHRRRLVFSANLREWHHFMRLRLDAHAQWEIRDLAGRIAALLRGPFPVLARLFAGKDRWPAVRDRF